jgi:serine O-acetyltransferase
MADPPEIPQHLDELCVKERLQTNHYRTRLPSIVDRMVDTCYDQACFEHVDASPLPSRERVIELVEICKDILFPGYFRSRDIDSINLKYRLGLEISGLYDKLAREIAHAIRHECIRYGHSCLHCEEMGEEKAFRFLETLPELRAVLATDVRAAYDGDPAASSYDEIIFSYPGILAILTYRVAHRLHELGVPILPRIMTEYAHSTTGIDIHPGARIGESFFIDHGTGVVVGQTAVIGKRVKVYQGVTLGAVAFRRTDSGELDRKSKRHPTLEDDVTVYAGSTILGGDTIIGARSVIGGNVWLTRSIPPDTKVLLNPPELVLQSKATPEQA